MWRHVLRRQLPWLLVVLWVLLVGPALLRPAETSPGAVDFLAYRLAADALQRGESPYQTPEQSRQIWRSYHQAEADLLAAYARGTGREFLQAQSSGLSPGPYLYPPTLALLVAQFGITAPAMQLLILLAIIGFGWLWLRSAQAGPWWLLLVLGSWDVLASLTGGNVELVLLFATLLAAWLLWGRRWALAAPLIALVILIKPFYALFFLAFGLLLLVQHGADRRAALRVLLGAAALALALIGVEAARWGPELRAETLQYLRHALDYQWFVLPLPEQTPMSDWNRTLFQVLVGAGLPLGAAQALAVGLWALLAALTLWRVRRRPLTFAQTFALAFVLLYLGRPVGWGLIYLELVVLVVAWPALGRAPRAILLAAALALMLSHWWALALTAGGHGIPLLTLQRAEWPWETLLVLPLSWLVVLWSARAGVQAT